MITAITMFRFLFVVVWKSYRQMNDDLIAWIIVIQAGVITLLVNLSNIFRMPGKYLVSKQYSIFIFWCLILFPSKSMSCLLKINLKGMYITAKNRNSIGMGAF